MLDESAHREELAADEERRTHAQPNYMAIFWWLFGLTVLEVCYSVFTHPPKLVLMTGARRARGHQGDAWSPCSSCT